MVAPSPGTTFFHTDQWIEALLQVFPRWRNGSQIIRLPDGRDVLLPMLVTDRVGPWLWLDAMPFGCFGGPVVSEGGLSRADMAHILQAAYAGAGWLAINLDPCEPLANADYLPMGVTPISTHLLSLSGEVERGFTKTVRYDMRRAEREGVTARKGATLEEFFIYYELTQKAARRWDMSSPMFPRTLYQALAALPSEHVNLWLAEYDGKTIGGLINIFYTPGRALHWASALDPAYAHLNPTKLLQREAIKNACERGATVYNMGPSVGFDGKPLAGVLQAKEALGAKAHDYAIAIMMNSWGMRARAVRNRLTRHN
jgi:hypothetical protein